MSFIRAKEIPPRSGNWYDYEVESYRDKGQVKQRIIQYIGRSGTVKNPVLIGHEVVGIEKQPIVKILEPEPVEESNA
ncbi:MAG: hypothetical protein PHQ86_07780 [Dehalococcoidales bacterium]|nr:hypothetical protein [Dehalococcoidales bacterium]